MITCPSTLYVFGVVMALLLALAGLVVGALLVGLAGKPGPTFVAGASSTPVSCP